MLVKIYAPCSPCDFENKDVKTVYKFKMSCGGGLGGSMWYEYVQTDDKITPNSMITCIDAMTGEQKIINTNYIVKVETVKYLAVTWDITKHTNYDRKTVNKQIKTIYYQIPISDNYEIYPTYKYIEHDDPNYITQKTITI